ncbi:MAG: T9SS type A sorting domain-containing protein [Bacteroidota bacterium]|nr:T9SS type A sorting domain-containing protein [Bacteroidota bacterium]
MHRHHTACPAGTRAWIHTLFLLFFLPVVGQAQYTPGSWPASFIDYTDSTGSYIQDVSDQSPPETDVIFSASTPSSVLVSTDGTHAFFRFQLSADPFQPNGQWSSFGWVVEIGDSTGQGASIGAVAVVASGSTLDVIVRDPSTQDVVYSYGKRTANPGAVRSLAAGSSGYYYLDFQVPMAALTSRIGIDANSKLRFFYGSSASGATVNKDYMTGSAVSFIGLTTTNFNAIQNGTLVPLPVELSAFSAFLKGSTAELRWNTATELNNYGFEVQRSVNGRAWEVRDFVPGAGTAQTPRSYAWSEDLLDLHGTVRYRLRQLDRDGSEELHAVVELLAGPAAVSGFTALYPQPARTHVTVSYRSSAEGATRLGLYDLAGRRLRDLGGDAGQAAAQTRVVDLDALTPGSYMLRLEENGRVHNRVLLIAR